MSKILEIKELYFFYFKGKDVLKNINLDVEEGESITIFGPNGSGKSTLIKIILTFLKPYKGEILFKKRNIFNFDNSKIGKIFSYVPQKVNLNFPMSVFDYLLLGRVPYVNGFIRKKDTQFVQSWIERMGIDKLKDKNFLFLSEGEKQIVTLIRSFIQESKVILLDEPLTHLDLKYRSKVLNLIKEIKISGKTIISIFHDIESTKFISDRVVLLKEGEIFDIGKPDEILKKEHLENLFLEPLSNLFFQ